MRPSFQLRALKTCAHAALAQPLQQHVGAEQQPVAATLEELVGLIRRQPASKHQFSCQGTRLGEPVLQFERDFIQLAASRRRDSRRASVKSAAETVGMGYSHGTGGFRDRLMAIPRGRAVPRSCPVMAFPRAAGACERVCRGASRPPRLMGNLRFLPSAGEEATAVPRKGRWVGRPATPGAGVSSGATATDRSVRPPAPTAGRDSILADRMLTESCGRDRARLRRRSTARHTRPARLPIARPTRPARAARRGPGRPASASTFSPRDRGRPALRWTASGPTGPGRPAASRGPACRQRVRSSSPTCGPILAESAPGQGRAAGGG